MRFQNSPIVPYFLQLRVHYLNNGKRYGLDFFNVASSNCSMHNARIMDLHLVSIYDSAIHCSSFVTLCNNWSTATNKA